jgi:serine protease Do
MRFRHLVAVMGLALAVFVGTQLTSSQGSTSGLAIAQETTSVARDPGESTIIRVARQATPAVVSVTAPRVGSGSGVVISADGVILTNNHVVGNARVVEVGFVDGRRVQGRVLGRDPTLDIAVVRVAETGLIAAPLGDSDRLEVGQTAIAIGNPIGLDRTVTTGIVSAVNRSPRGFELGGLIQTDAPINPGNSGGPLLDSQGRVIGINSAILRGTTGLGFAIPINLARNIAEQVISTGRITRPYLGVSTSDIDVEAARAAGIDLREGVIVRDVGMGSPADRAGITLYDIITHVSGAPVQSTGELVRILRSRRPGEVVELTIRSTDERGIPGAPRRVRVELAEAPVG